jgi:Flp pilus assembly protein TadD
MTTHSARPRIPLKAERLRLPLWQRSQARVRERYGFDLSADDALQRANTLLASKPDDAEAHLLVAAVLSTRGDNTMAEAEVRRALDLEPRLARARTTLATLLVQRGANEEGLNEARNAAALDKEDPTILYNLGLAEWVAGDRKTAKAAFDRATEALDAQSAPANGGAPQRRRWWQRWRRGDG